MDVPEGAIAKAWGWQKQVLSDGGIEVWLGYANGGGQTSVHRHDHYSQQVVSLSASIRIREFAADGTSKARILRQNDWTDCGVKHQLEFLGGGMFVETYLPKEPTGAPPVTEDTIRE